MIRDLYPDADVLSQSGYWDEATRRVVFDRVHNVPEFRFFGQHQQRSLEALAEAVVPQAHRPAQRRIAIAPWIDQICAQTEEHGVRYDDMPSQRGAWVQGLVGLDETARIVFDADFADLSDEQRREVVQRIAGGNPPGSIWRDLPPLRWWQVLAVRQITGIYYAHPYAWDEIGFGGPAYPRGYYALNHGAPEPWEAREHASYTEEELRSL
jgi:Gluconate 2-dehydrogenase subunit 3